MFTRKKEEFGRGDKSNLWKALVVLLFGVEGMLVQVALQ